MGTAPAFISKRITFKGKTVVISVAVSFFVMIIALTISAGFRNEIRRSLGEMGGDIRITPPVLNFDSREVSLKCSSGFCEEVGQLKGVETVCPVVYRSAVASCSDNIQGVIFKGVESFAATDSVSMSVRIPRNLARRLALAPGSRMPAYFIGEEVVARNFTVNEVYDAVTVQDDRMIVFCDINVLRRVNQWDKDVASAVEIHLDEYGLRHKEAVEQQVSMVLFRKAQKENLMCTSLESYFPQIFDWLHLVDNNVIFILLIMTIVAGFNMITGLLILLFENIRTIGLLKSLGMQNRQIGRVFVLSSSRLVGLGLVAGNVAALVLCLLQQHTHLMKLNPENYFLSFLPVSIDWNFILICDLASFAVIILLVLIPCSFITGVDPAKTMRN